MAGPTSRQVTLSRRLEFATKLQRPVAVDFLTNNLLSWPVEFRILEDRILKGGVERSKFTDVESTTRL